MSFLEIKVKALEEKLSGINKALEQTFKTVTSQLPSTKARLDEIRDKYRAICIRTDLEVIASRVKECFPLSEKAVPLTTIDLGLITHLCTYLLERSQKLTRTGIPEGLNFRSSNEFNIGYLAIMPLGKDDLTLYFDISQQPLNSRFSLTSVKLFSIAWTEEGHEVRVYDDRLEDTDKVYGKALVDLLACLDSKRVIEAFHSAMCAVIDNVPDFHLPVTEEYMFNKMASAEKTELIYVDQTYRCVDGSLTCVEGLDEGLSWSDLSQIEQFAMYSHCVNSGQITA